MTQIKAELIDHMGSDLTVVNAARVSFDKESLEFDVRDRHLLRYLAMHNHFTPFTHCQITLREHVPIFVARQRFKHKVGFTENEISRRYVDDHPFFFSPVWRKRAESVKQGSGEEFSATEQLVLTERYLRFLDAADGLYDFYLDYGVCPEQARMVLPQSMMTSYYVTGSLMAFARAYKQRSDSHSQKEIRDLAEHWDRIIRPLFPHSWAALVDA